MIKKLKKLCLYFIMFRFHILTMYYLYKSYKEIDGYKYLYAHYMNKVHFYDEKFENTKF